MGWGVRGDGNMEGGMQKCTEEGGGGRKGTTFCFCFSFSF